MPKKSRSGQNVNYGIRASTVTATNIAVGRNAAATTFEGRTERANLMQEIESLRGALDRSGISKEARQSLDEDVSALSRSLQTEKLDRDSAEGSLKRFLDKLKTFGVIVGDIAEIVGPVSTIATALKIPLASLGLSI